MFPRDPMLSANKPSVTEKSGRQFSNGQERISRFDHSIFDNFGVNTHIVVTEFLEKDARNIQVTLCSQRIYIDGWAADGWSDHMESHFTDSEFDVDPIEFRPGGDPVKVYVGAKTYRINRNSRDPFELSDAGEVDQGDVLVRG